MEKVYLEIPRQAVACYLSKDPLRAGEDGAAPLFPRCVIPAAPACVVRVVSRCVLLRVLVLVLFLRSLL